MSAGAAGSAFNRRELARRLTRSLEASAADSLANFAHSRHGDTPRIGITGAPGAGKSSLLDQLAMRRIERAEPLAILAIDPTSPLTRGSILGDRVRMAKAAGDPRLYIRSVPSRRAQDGLCDNVADLLLVLEDYGFAEILIETVGVGQAEYAVRSQVDTVVLIVPPNAGDTVQAMKAGILEIADIVAINKCDLPGADKTRLELKDVIDRRAYTGSQWQPQVLMTSATRGEGIAALDDLIQQHQTWVRTCKSRDQVRRDRARHHIECLLERRVREVIAAAPEAIFSRSLAAAFTYLSRELSDRPGGQQASAQDWPT